MKMFQALAVAALAFAVSAAAAAPGQAQTLDRILKEKKIRITAELTSPPFGIIDKDGQPAGSEVETARALAKDLGVELELVQVTGPSRIPTLLSGRADLAISSLSITTERAKAVMFANPHGALNIVIAGPQKTAIKTAADMVGKRIGITRGTLEEAETPKIAPQGANLVFYDDIGATIQAMLSGQVDAMGMSEHAVKSVAERAPDQKIETKFRIRTAYYAAAVKPGDYDLLQWVNTWVFQSKQNGTLARIYEKWMGIPLVDLPTL
jgi:polar amino acid transport system substrate-binding protein